MTHNQLLQAVENLGEPSGANPFARVCSIPLSQLEVLADRIAAEERTELRRVLEDLHGAVLAYDLVRNQGAEQAQVAWAQVLDAQSVAWDWLSNTRYSSDVPAH